MLVGALFSPSHLALALLKESGKEFQTEIRGASMTPLITEGDRVSLRMVAPAKLKIGDILAFLVGENIVVHRIILKTKLNGQWWFCQKGDNGSEWSWIPEEAILGKAEAVRRLNYTLDLAQWPWTWINPCMGLAHSSLVGVQETALAHNLAWPSRQFIPAGNRILRILMKAFCSAPFRRAPRRP
jgi:signal peptidase I